MMNYILKALSNFIGEHNTVLDVGCGDKSYTKFGKVTTVDAWEKLRPDYLLNLENERLSFEENSFDFILMLDFIEHLDRDKGEITLADCKKIVKDKIFLLTPLIFNDNSVNVNDANCWAYGNDFDYHKSLWTLEDFKDWKSLVTTDEFFFGYWKK